MGCRGCTSALSLRIGESSWSLRSCTIEQPEAFFTPWYSLEPSTFDCETQNFSLCQSWKFRHTAASIELVFGASVGSDIGLEVGSGLYMKIVCFGVGVSWHYLRMLVAGVRAFVFRD